jgi:hypothetical protein
MMKRRKATALLILSMLLTAFAQEKKETPLPFFEQPFLITSAGQSAEVQLASILAKKAGITSSLFKLAAAKDLEKTRTLVLVLGVSLKGLGAAGLDIVKERARVNSLLEEARNKNIDLLCLHLGGEARRGELSDDLASACLRRAKMAIVVKAGNKDGFFTKVCQEHNIPLAEVEKTIDALTPLQQITRKHCP